MGFISITNFPLDRLSVRSNKVRSNIKLQFRRSRHVRRLRINTPLIRPFFIVGTFDCFIIAYSILDCHVWFEYKKLNRKKLMMCEIFLKKCVFINIIGSYKLETLNLIPPNLPKMTSPSQIKYNWDTIWLYYHTIRGLSLNTASVSYVWQSK